MATFRKLEEIKAWSKARELTRLIYEATAKGHFASDYDLRDQIRRASVSIMANVAEGFGRRSDNEFANFLNMAHGSIYEVQSHLYVALDLQYIDKDFFDQQIILLNEIAGMILVLAQHLRGSKI